MEIPKPIYLHYPINYDPNGVFVCAFECSFHSLKTVVGIVISAT